MESPQPLKRARNSKGQLKADDPSTPDINEAFEQPTESRDLKLKSTVGKPKVKSKAAAPRVGKNQVVTKPSFGSVYSVSN